MSSVRDLQRAFSAALVSRDVSAIDAAIAAGGRGADARFAVYANNVHAGMSEALADVYPVIARLIGAACFSQVARRYVREFPAPTGNVHDFGALFAEHLERIPELAELAYLPDVARLEWAWHRVFHAPDTDARFAANALASIPQSRWPSLCVDLHPAVQWVSSRFPILAIWHANQVGADPDAVVDLDAGGDCVLVHRDGIEVRLTAIDSGLYALLTMLGASRPLGSAVEVALHQQPTFDVARALARLAAKGLLLRWRDPLDADHRSRARAAP
jgi:hypothetical protein